MGDLGMEEIHWMEEDLEFWHKSDIWPDSCWKSSPDRGGNLGRSKVKYIQGHHCVGMLGEHWDLWPKADNFKER